MKMVQIKDLPEINIVNANDLLVVQTSTNSITSKVTKANLLKELGAGGLTTWQVINNNTDIIINSKNIIIESNKILNFPLVDTLDGVNGEIEILSRFDTGSILLNLNGNKINKQLYPNNDLALSANSYLRLIYINPDIGFFPVEGEDSLFRQTNYPGSPNFWIEDGSLTDKAGNISLALVSSGSSIAIFKNSSIKRSALRFNGTPQELAASNTFLNNTIGATFYIVCTVNSGASYNLISTRPLDGYYRFSNDGNGYIATCLAARRSAYPPSMPSSGNHLFSLHCGKKELNDVPIYDFLQNNISKGRITNIAYDSGTYFRVCTNDNSKSFNGDLYLMLVYPRLILPTDNLHKEIITKIKEYYPILTFSI
jgi:hypothetical protein